MNKKFTVLIIGILLLVIAGGVFWWWQGEKEAKKAIEESEKETILTPELEKSMDVFVESIESKEIADQKILPEGLQIIKKGDKKIIINEVEGFQIEIPSDFILKECTDTGHFSLYKSIVYKEDLLEGGISPHLVPKIYIAVEEDSPRNSYLKEVTGEREEIILGGEKGYREKFPDSFNYILLKNNKIYFISTSLGPNYEEIIHSFKFLE